MPSRQPCPTPWRPSEGRWGTTPSPGSLAPGDLSSVPPRHHYIYHLNTGILQPEPALPDGELSGRAVVPAIAYLQDGNRQRRARFQMATESREQPIPMKAIILKPLSMPCWSSSQPISGVMIPVVS